MDRQRRRTAALWRGVLLLALGALCTVQPLGVAGALSPTPTTYQGGVMGTLAGTEDKPQSKLWRHAGSWWALMHSQVGINGEVHIFKLAADHTWQDTGTLVDLGISGRGDALSDGEDLYVVSRRNGGGVRVMKYLYEPALGIYKMIAGFPVLLSAADVESATIAKDSTGKLWVTYTAPNGSGAPKVWVTHSTSDHKTWAQPFELPAPDTTVTADDISAVIALDGKIGVLWSNQVSDAFRFVTHQDGAAPDQWQASETPLAGLDIANDHMNMKKAADGRLFAAVKTSAASPSKPYLILDRKSVV